MHAIFGVFMMIDLTIYLLHRVNEASSRLKEELAELAETSRLFERRHAEYLEAFYLMRITRLAISPSIGTVLQAEYRALSLN